MNCKPGDHILNVSISNSSNKLLADASYKFDMSVAPTAFKSHSLDEDNNFIDKNGKKIFLVTSFCIELSEIPVWKKNTYCNFLMGMGWNNSDFKRYLDSAQSNNLSCMGPARIHELAKGDKITSAEVAEFIKKYKELKF